LVETDRASGTMAPSNLPSLTFRDAAPSSGVDTLANPALYDGVLWRRTGAYLFDIWLLLIVDLVIHALLLCCSWGR
jgi:hypothetical protein